nr:FHA domain-containing protein [Streptomyces sp. QL37]
MSRLHCAVTVSDDGRVSVADLGSTNGTSLDGTDVHDRPVRRPGADAGSGPVAGEPPDGVPGG